MKISIKPKTSLLNKGTRRIFLLILKGKHKRVIDIANFFNLKRTSVYDDINRLKKEGLIKILPKHKGYKINYKKAKKSNELAIKIHLQEIKEIQNI